VIVAGRVLALARQPHGYSGRRSIRVGGERRTHKYPQAVVLILSKAERYREKADECRAAAASMTVPDQREHYLELAWI
jgi:hypothetical protein